MVSDFVESTNKNLLYPPKKMGNIHILSNPLFISHLEFRSSRPAEGALEELKPQITHVHQVIHAGFPSSLYPSKKLPCEFVKHQLGVAPSQDASDPQDYEPFLIRDPNLNLHLPLESWEGATPKTSTFIRSSSKNAAKNGRLNSNSSNGKPFKEPDAVTTVFAVDPIDKK